MCVGGGRLRGRKDSGALEEGRDRKVPGGGQRPLCPEGFSAGSKSTPHTCRSPRTTLEPLCFGPPEPVPQGSRSPRAPNRPGSPISMVSDRPESLMAQDSRSLGSGSPGSPIPSPPRPRGRSEGETRAQDRARVPVWWSLAVALLPGPPGPARAAPGPARPRSARPGARPLRASAASWFRPRAPAPHRAGGASGGRRPRHRAATPQAGLAPCGGRHPGAPHPRGVA